MLAFFIFFFIIIIFADAVFFPSYHRITIFYLIFVYKFVNMYFMRKRQLNSDINLLIYRL